MNPTEKFPDMKKRIKNRSLYVEWDRATGKLAVFQMNKCKDGHWNMKEVATFANVRQGTIYESGNPPKTNEHEKI